VRLDPVFIDKAPRRGDWILHDRRIQCEAGAHT
jgi:hypothetical protein